MSGYLQRSKGNKKQGKRLWFVIKDKVLYTYAASEVSSYLRFCEVKNYSPPPPPPFYLMYLNVCTAMYHCTPENLQKIHFLIYF